MTGIPLHPLRLAALQEGRLSVLRVPMTNLGNVKLVERADPADWNAGRAHPNMRRFEDWYKGDGALFWTDTGSVVFVPAPYAPGDYFVKEAWDEKMFSGFTEAQGEYDAWGVIYKADYPQDRKVKWQSARSMPEKFSRYILTLGPPVPGKLGEVKVFEVAMEGALKAGPINGDEYQTFWNTIYPRHPWSPDLWTWAYSATWRKKTC